MSHIRRPLTIGLAVAVAATAVVTRSASASGDDGTRVLRFTSVQVAETELDLGAAGFSPGDQIVFSDDLKRSGHKIGTDAGVCTVVRVAGADTEFTCVTTFRLPRGTIAVQAMFSAADLPDVRLAITGGTGAYRDAGGQGRTLAGEVAPVTLYVD
ncbi:MAG: allene oxide cyclase barrel-like domain-containing protein [Actinomycetes bacterium]